MSGLFFATKASVTRRNIGLNAIGIFPKAKFSSNLPWSPNTHMGRLLAYMLDPLVEKMKKKLVGWKACLLFSHGPANLTQIKLICTI